MPPLSLSARNPFGLVTTPSSGSALLRTDGCTWNGGSTSKSGSGYDKGKVNDSDRWDTASGGAGGDWCIVDAWSEAGTGRSRVSVR